MDCDESLLFKGKINMLVLNPAREFVLEHADKVERFIEKFKELTKEKTLSVELRLWRKIAKYGDYELNLDHFNKLDNKILEYVLCAAKTVAKKKFGYQRSFMLSLAQAFTCTFGNQFCLRRKGNGR